MLRLSVAVLVGILGAVVVAQPVSADTQRYILKSDSSISVVCLGCKRQAPAPEPLEGSFEVTSLPLGQPYGVAAVTNVNLRSRSFALSGNGFWQRLGLQRQAMVLDTSINGASVLLTSGRRQALNDADFAIVLSSGSAAAPTYVLVISAAPEVGAEPDLDGDRVPDLADNCPAQANADQADGDGDGVGDACDKCAETVRTDRVTKQGCSVEQLCPCGGPVGGGEWESLGTYLRCVSRNVRKLRREASLSRAEGRTLIRRAVQSGCGRLVVAMR